MPHFVVLLGCLESGVFRVQEPENSRPVVLIKEIDAVLLLHFKDHRGRYFGVVPHIALDALLCPILIHSETVSQIQCWLDILGMGDGGPLLVAVVFPPDFLS